jgi:hypothetical protein
VSQRLAWSLGFWSALGVAVLGTIYLGLLIVFFATEGFTFPPTAPVQLAGGLITFLTAPLLVVLVAAVRQVTPPEKRLLGTLGLAFTVLFVESVSINRFVQLTIVRLSPPGLASDDLARFLPYSTGSVMFALEILGWGFFLSLATLCLAPLFAGDRLQRAIRWLLVLFTVFSLLSVVGFATNTPVTAGAFVAWGPILLALAIGLAIYFYRGAPVKTS